MKHFYLILLLLFSLLTSAQDTAELPSTSEEPATFKLYPNPAVDDVVYIKTKNNSVKEVTVFDVFGEVVLRDRITGTSLNIAKLIPGVYVLHVVENKKSMNRKLVVK